MTIDDARLEILEVFDVLAEFEVMPLIGVVAGWTDREQPQDSEPTLARLVDHLHWYDGAERRIDLGDGQSVLISAQADRDAAIDQVLSAIARDGSSMVLRIWDQLSTPTPTASSRVICNWSELSDLHRRGSELASHSVSHCRLARCSETRLSFEVQESKRLIREKAGPCNDFIYPFGTDDVVDAHTTAVISGTGYRSAWLTRAGFATPRTSSFHLPRLEIPDGHVRARDFRARVLGGQVPFAAIKHAGVGLLQSWRHEHSLSQKRTQ